MLYSYLMNKNKGCPNLDDVNPAQLIIQGVNLIEPPFFGPRFTWTNGHAN